MEDMSFFRPLPGTMMAVPMVVPLPLSRIPILFFGEALKTFLTALFTFVFSALNVKADKAFVDRVTGGGDGVEEDEDDLGVAALDFGGGVDLGDDGEEVDLGDSVADAGDKGGDGEGDDTSSSKKYKGEDGGVMDGDGDGVGDFCPPFCGKGTGSDGMSGKVSSSQGS